MAGGGVNINAKLARRGLPAISDLNMSRGSDGVYSQDSFQDPNQFTPESAAASNAFWQAHPEIYAAQQRRLHTMPMWQQLLLTFGPVLGAGALAGAFGGAGAAAGGAGSAGAGAGGGATPLGLGYGVGLGEGAAAGVPTGLGAGVGVGGTGLGAGGALSPLLAGGTTLGPVFSAGATGAAGAFGAPLATGAGAGATTLGTLAGTGGGTVADPLLPGYPADGYGSGGFSPATPTGGINWANVMKNVLGQKTGSTTEQLIGSIPNIAGYLGQLAKGRAQGRVDEATQGALADRTAIDRYQAQLQASQQEAQRAQLLAQTELNQKIFAANEQERQNRNATRGGLLQGMEDATISGLPEGVTVPTLTGGLRPSAISHRQEIGDAIYRNAMTELLDHPNAPTAHTTADTFNFSPLPTAPALTPPQNAGAGDTALNWAATGLGLVGALRPPATPTGSTAAAGDRTPIASMAGTVPIQPQANVRMTPGTPTPGTFDNRSNASFLPTSGPSIYDNPRLPSLSFYDPNDPYGLNRNRNQNPFR